MGKDKSRVIPNHPPYGISLPLASTITESDMDCVCNCLKKMV